MLYLGVWKYTHPMKKPVQTGASNCKMQHLWGMHSSKNWKCWMLVFTVWHFICLFIQNFLAILFCSFFWVFSRGKFTGLPFCGTVRPSFSVLCPACPAILTVHVLQNGWQHNCSPKLALSQDCLKCPFPVAELATNLQSTAPATSYLKPITQSTIITPHFWCVKCR